MTFFEEQKNPQRKKRSLMKTYVSGVKFERIAMDIAGPFPKSENGYVYILVVADYFTKFTEIYPLPNIEAETVAEAIFKGWIKRYGCPREIHSDQGRQFESKLFQEMCRLLQINKTRTTPYHPRSDRMIECLNKTIKQILSRYILISQTDLDRYIDGIAMAYNSTPHETTGITPYRMVFGTEISIPLDIVSDRMQEGEEEEVPVSESEYVRNLENELDIIYQVEKLLENQRNVKRYSTIEKCTNEHTTSEISFDVIKRMSGLELKKNCQEIGRDSGLLYKDLVTFCM